MYSLRYQWFVQPKRLIVFFPCQFVFKLHFVLGEISYYITAIKSGYESLQALVPLYSFGYPLMLLPGLEGRNCIADEHYLPTFLHVSPAASVILFPILLVLLI